MTKDKKSVHDLKEMNEPKCYYECGKPESDPIHDINSMVIKTMLSAHPFRKGEQRTAPFIFNDHNHCFREDGTCYGAYASEPDGKCATRCHEDNGKKYPWCHHEIKEGKEKKIHKAPCPKAYFNETWNLDCDKQRCQPPESRGDWDMIRQKISEQFPIIATDEDILTRRDRWTDFICFEINKARTEGIEEGRAEAYEIVKNSWVDFNGKCEGTVCRLYRKLLSSLEKPKDK